MRTVVYNKLVRDRIPEIIQGSGKACRTEELSDEEYIEKLDAKLNEELLEYQESKSMEELADLLEVLGNRDVAVCRELTKLHEEVVRTTLSQALALYRQQRPRGEFVLVIRGAPAEKGPRLSLEEAMVLVERFRAGGLSLKDAARQAAAESGQSRNDLYHAALVKDSEK